MLQPHPRWPLPHRRGSNPLARLRHPSPVVVASAKAADALLRRAEPARVGCRRHRCGRAALRRADRADVRGHPPHRPDTGGHRHSMLVSGGHCASQLMPAKDGPVIPDVGRTRCTGRCRRCRGRTVTGTGWWCSAPGSAVGPRVTAWTSRSSGLPPAMFGVTAEGVPHLQTVVRGHPGQPRPAAGQLGCEKLPRRTLDLRLRHPVHWRGPGVRTGAVRRPRTARVLGEALDMTIWDGDSLAVEAVPRGIMLGAQGGVSQTLSVDELGDGEYVAVSKRDGDLGDFVYFWLGALPGRAVDTAPGSSGAERSRGRTAQVRAARASPGSAGQRDSSWWLSLAAPPTSRGSWRTRTRVSSSSSRSPCRDRGHLRRAGKR